MDDGVLEERVNGLEKLMAEQFASRDKALVAALVALEKRLDGMNEFRETLSDQASRMITRPEYQAAHNAMGDGTDKRLNAIESKLANWDGRLWAIGAVFLVFNVVVSWFMSSRPLPHL